ncbi:MAG: thioredoxin [Oscillospiraceae bacterium]|jgi:thioredoxin 1|nr:thioredoxin [Oscillospiraceae bacterium]
MAVLTVTKDNFMKEVLKSEEIVLIDFWASWCTPCKMLSPVVDEVAEESGIKVCKVNIDEQPELASAFDIASIPTLIVVKNSEVVNTSVGVIPKEKILELINI